MQDSVPTQNYGWLLERELLEDVRGTRCALLASSDGIVRFYCGLQRHEAETLAAMATAQLGIAKQVGENYGKGPNIRQVLSELDDLIFYVIVAGDNGVLAALADASVDAGRMTHRMHELARKAPTQLSTPARVHLGATDRHE